MSSKTTSLNARAKAKLGKIGGGFGASGQGTGRSMGGISGMKKYNLSQVKKHLKSEAMHRALAKIDREHYEANN
jgi:hypothetical protein